MSISEACQVWIEQRIEEELEVQSHTNKSLRAIGRDLAKEIEKVFEAKIQPMTLTMKAARMQGVTNVTPQATPEYDSEIQENQVGEHGGQREGAGRPIKYESEVVEKNDSEKLRQLKRWWKLAGKNDRKRFLIWIKENKNGQVRN